MLELSVAREVREIFAGTDLEALAEVAASGWECMACGQPGGRERASVLAVQTAGPGGAPVTMARLAHGRCAPSQVVPGPEVLVVPDSGVSMRALAVVLPHPAGPRPLLVTELVAPVLGVPVPGMAARWDLATSVLRGLGLHLLATPWEPAPPAARWRAVLGRETAVVFDPDGGEYYDGDLAQPPQWRALAARGTVELIAGTRGLGGAAGDAEAGIEVLGAAARDGRLVGATVAAEVTA